MQKTAFLSREPEFSSFRYVTKTSAGLPQGSPRRTPRLLGRQILLAMKLTALLLTVAILNVSARGFSQTINYTGKDVSLKTVFAVIKQQTGYVVFYDQALVDRAKPVTVQAENEPLEAFLKNVLEGESLDFSIEQKAIVITKREKEISSPEVKAAIVSKPPDEITGRVTNKEGEPLVGASIVIKKKNRGTSTNAKGTFELKDIEVGDEIVITYTGYASQTIKITSLKSLNVVLVRSDSPLDEVQVIAYGTTTQRYSTSNIATVTSKQIEEQPVTNPLLALQGLVPGLVIQQQSGYANAGVSVDIRGQASLAAGSSPLYVVDGIPYPPQMLPQTFWYGLGSSTSGYNSFGAQAGNTLAYINPSDIESISILKDADATSIYGARASGGAVLITTKKGKAGPIRVTADVQQGWGKITRFAKMLSLSQYLEMRHEAFANAGMTPSSTDYDINGTWDTTRSTDWQRTLLGNTQKWSNLSLSISGGNANTNYYLSGTYHSEGSIYPAILDVNNKKGSTHFSLNSTSPNGKFTAQENFDYQYDFNKDPGGDLTTITQYMSPDAPAIFNKDGSLNWAVNSTGNETWSNPLSILYTKEFVKVNNLIGNTRLSYKILPTLELSLNAGYTYMQQYNYDGQGLNSYAPSQLAYAQRQARYFNGNQIGWNIEPQLSYRRTIAKGQLEALAGGAFNQQQSAQQGLEGIGFVSDALMQDPRSAVTLQYQGTVASLYRYNGWFGRLNYRWEDKYILSLNGRHDGSSRFGSDNKFHSFGSAAAAWIFSNEKMLKNSKFLSFGKLTASYGTTGNDQIGDYQYLSLYYSNSSGPVPYQGTIGLAPNGYPNPNLQWEVQHKLDARVDFGFAHDRILVSADYYRDRSSNLLLSYPLPHIAGFTSYAANLPATIQFSGAEFVLKTVNVKARDFGWTSSFNITLRRNKIIAFPGLAQSPYFHQFYVGGPYTGQTEFTFAGLNPQTGIYQFVNYQGKIVDAENASYQTDKLKVLNQQPSFFGGFQNNVHYKSFQLDFFFQFSKQRQSNINGGFYYPGLMENQPTAVLSRWQKPGDHTTEQAYSVNPTYAQLLGYYFSQNSDFGAKNIYYIRLKNISLSWQMPGSWAAKIAAKECSLFIHAENRLTITNYVGLDPETGPRSLAPMKVTTVGVRVTL